MSERQWLDILGVLKVQRDALDLDFLHSWANRLQLQELLQRALKESGLTPPED